MTKKEAEDMLKRHRKEAFWDFFDFLLCSVSKPRLSSDFFSYSISTLKKSCH